VVQPGYRSLHSVTPPGSRTDWSSFLFSLATPSSVVISPPSPVISEQTFKVGLPLPNLVQALTHLFLHGFLYLSFLVARCRHLWITPALLWTVYPRRSITRHRASGQASRTPTRFEVVGTPSPGQAVLRSTAGTAVPAPAAASASGPEARLSLCALTAT
jgi:hypothetical protein